MNFYQSTLRQTINRDIYRKPAGTITLAGQTYQYIIKQKSALGVDLNWYQIVGVELPVEYLNDPLQFREHIMSHCYDAFSGQGDCFVQLGLINELGVSPVSETKSQEYNQTRDDLRRQQGSGIMRLGGYESLVENMPSATIMIDLNQTADELWSDLSSRTRTQISKARKHGLTVELATESDRDEWYQMRVETGDGKGFAVQSRNCYDALHRYLVDTHQGNLYIVRDGDTIVAGAIVVYVDDVCVYLYGATRRQIGNLGHAQLLHRHIMEQAKLGGYLHYDLLGASPGSAQPHHLDGVTQFKSGFGGSKIEYLGNYDFPLSQWKYQVFKRYKKVK